MPTYNAEKYLRRCLESINKLIYPSSRIEVISGDGGSTDRTLEILSQYNVKIINNPYKDAESGKLLAFKQSKGELIVFIDADNIIASRLWLLKMLKPLWRHSNIIGVESSYLIAKDFGSLNKYVSRMIIVDPLARLLASKPVVEKYRTYIIKYFHKGDTPVSGANGFIWRRKIIDDNFKGASKLNEVDMLNRLTHMQDLQYANVINTGIYHYYCTGITEYMEKRQKIAKKFLIRQDSDSTWVAKKSKISIILSVLYLATIIGPTFEALYNAWRYRTLSWLWHPVISFFTVLLYGFYALKHIVHNKGLSVNK